MKKIFLGIFIGAAGTIALQRLYKKNIKFRTLVNSIRETAIMEIEGEKGERVLNVFDRLSLICQRVKRLGK
jgi:hypothetical protein